MHLTQIEIKATEIMNKFGKVGNIPHLSVGFTREFANFFHKISVGVTNGDYMLAALIVIAKAYFLP